MRYLKLLLVAVALSAVLMPAGAFAFEPRQGDSVIIRSDETVNDDFYISAGTIDMQGTINGDLFAAGGNITIKGTINGDLFVVGGNITVDSSVAGDVWAAGGSIAILGNIGGNVHAAGGSIAMGSHISKDVVVGTGSLVAGSLTEVGRDFVIGAGSANISGKIGRNILASSSDLTLNGTIGGNVEADSDSLKLADGASITGNLTYYSNREATISAGAKIQGKTARQPARVQREDRQRAETAADRFVGWFRSLVGLFALGLLLILPFPRFSQRATDTLVDSPWASLGLGFGLLVGVPVAAFILFIIGLLVGGWWIPLMALALYGIAIALGFVIVGLLVGQWTLFRVGRPGTHTVWALLLGIFILTVAGLVPVLGGLVGFAALLLGLGALVLATIRIYRSTTPSPAS